jgi:hypothetical protein
MSILLHEISAISDKCLEVMQAVMSREEQAKEVTGEDSAPLDLAQALSDYFQTAALLETGEAYLEEAEMAEFANYGLNLLDRLAYLVRQLELMEQRDNMSLVCPSMALWLARREAVIDNLEGASDGFGMLVNALSDTTELAEMCRMMDEVIEATSEQLQLDHDRDNPWRPWRIINLNMGIAATRSLDPELMEVIFDKLGRRLPYDMAGFLADGKRQMMVSNVPDEVVDIMNRYVEKWPSNPPH